MGSVGRFLNSAGRHRRQPLALLERAACRTVVVSDTLNHPSQLIDPTAALELMMGAMNLVASEGQ